MYVVCPLSAVLAYSQTLSHLFHTYTYIIELCLALGQPVQNKSINQHQFLDIVRLLQQLSPVKMNPPLFIFKFSEEAASHNAKILADHSFDLDRVIRSQHPSQISYGSEFCHSNQLEELLADHPLWWHLKDILDNGASFPLANIPDKDRSSDLVFHSTRGNRKSVLKNHNKLLEIITEDVERGFALPLPVTALHFLPNASLAPLGCIQQSSLDSSGKKMIKFRMTHDQSFPGPSNLSVNLRVQNDKLPPIMYSFVLLCTIHYILSIRSRHPYTKIFLCKFDIDAAYRHCTFSG
jgi:hypothetical protein